MPEELKPHQIAQLVNKLRDIATKYHAHGCLRELISCEVNAALTQRPAAQTEREADGLSLIVAGAIFDFAGFMTSRSEVIEVGSTADAGPVADLVKEWAELRGLDLADAAVLSWQLHITRASLPAPQQATPEPVGEPFGYFRALPFGWEQCGEHDDGAVALYDHPAPGGPVGEVAATVAEVHMGRYTLELNGKPYPEGTKLYTRPAPGVPEEKPLPELMLASYHEAVGWNACRAAMLAAAQAKGGQ